MNRLDTERQKELEPKRVAFTKKELIKMGYEITSETSTKIEFHVNGERVQYFPYSGWHTGKSIKDGRGWKNLYKQLIELQNK